METYKVRRAHKAKLVEFISQALLTSGFTIKSTPDPGVAPFVFSVVAPWGRALDLICYAFYANKYGQKNRPQDEHRFQVKYGGSFSRAHTIYISESADVVTLMFGAHLNENVIVAVDPAMHNPTWFSRSVFFKTSHVAEIRREGWIGWERDRRPSRHGEKSSEIENYQSETLLGLTPDRLADYVLLQQQTVGCAPGERLLAIETGAFGEDEQHALEQLLQLPVCDILDGIKARNRLLVAVRGAAAEIHLHRLLSSESALSSVAEIDRDGQPDFEVAYRGKPFRIECKNTARTLTFGRPKVDFQKTRASKGNPCSRYYRPEQFEILAACLHPISMRWEFKFVPTKVLLPHPKCLGHLHHRVLVDDDVWTPSVVEALEACARSPG